VTDADPPTPGPVQIPTIGTVSRQLQGVAGQMHGARNDIDTLIERVVLVQQDLADLRKRLWDAPAPSAAGVALSPDVRPSMAVKAGKATLSFGKYTAIALGVLGVAGQIAAQLKPGLVGPIQIALQLLGGSP